MAVRVGFGVMNMVSSPDPATVRDSYADMFHEVGMANDAGFAGVWVTEHHFSTYSLTSSPLVLLSRIAALAPRLRVGTSVLVLPFWDPVRLAADVLTLDAITGGRVDLGIGRGYQAHEFHGFGQDPERSREAFEEAVALIRQLFTQPDRAFAGSFHRVNAPVTLLPRPTQRPHPPIWMSATSEESVRFAAQHGFHFMTTAVTTRAQLADRHDLITRSLDAAGESMAGREYATNRFVYCGTDPEERRLVIREIGRQLSVSRAMAQGAVPVAGAAPGADEEPAVDEDLVREVLLAGSPEELVAELGGLAASGITYVIAGFRFGRLPSAVVRRSMALFAAKVLPALDIDRAPGR